MLVVGATLAVARVEVCVTSSAGRGKPVPYEPASGSALRRARDGTSPSPTRPRRCLRCVERGTGQARPLRARAGSALRRARDGTSPSPTRPRRCLRCVERGTGQARPLRARAGSALRRARDGTSPSPTSPRRGLRASSAGRGKPVPYETASGSACVERGTGQARPLRAVFPSRLRFGPRAGNLPIVADCGFHFPAKQNDAEQVRQRHQGEGDGGHQPDQGRV